MTLPAPTVSIIMPMHNVAPYVSAAIRSILSQSWQDFELIVVDDGSTDHSRQQAEATCADDSRVRFATQPNQGQSAARNLGLTFARGRYIYFFDSDDVLEPRALEICVGHAQDFDLDLVAFSGTAFNDASDAEEPAQVFRKPDLLDPAPGQDLLVALCRTRSFSVSCCLYLFSRQVIELPRLRFDEGFIHEDETFTTLLYCAARRAISLEAVLFRRRIRPGSTMTRPRAWEHVVGCIQSAKQIGRASAEGMAPLSPACRETLRSRQRTLLRQALVNAALSGTSARLTRLLASRFDARDIFRIDPLILPFALWCNLLRLFSLLRSKTV